MARTLDQMMMYHVGPPALEPNLTDHIGAFFTGPPHPNRTPYRRDRICGPRGRYWVRIAALRSTVLVL